MTKYEYFYSSKAYELIEWCVRVKNRIKASKIYNAACKMESAYRESRGLNYDCEGIKFIKARSLSAAKFMASLKAPYTPSSPNKHLIRH